MRYTMVAAAAVMLSTPIAAQDAAGDADAGAAHFNRQCVACHVIEGDDGEGVLAGRNARTGPNLYGIVGAPPGSRHEFSYSDSLVAYGETGATWAEENTVAFVQDPTGHLREALDNPRARSKMAYRLRNEDEARDIYAFLAQFSPEGTAESDTAQDAVKDPADRAPEDTAIDEEPHDLAAGETIFENTCRNCHGAKAQGMASFPALAGFDAAYLEERLEQYRSGEKVGPNSGLMIPVARELSDEDIANIAAFIATTFD